MKLGINVKQVGQMINAESISGEVTLIHTPEGGTSTGLKDHPGASPAKPLTNVVKVLFLASDPFNCERLALGREAREIGQRLREATAGSGFDVKHELAARPSDIDASILRHRPSIVHFSGHGGSAGALLLEDNQQQAVPVKPADLARLFRIVKGDIRCVVLNACSSEAHARAIAEHIDCVVGMAAPIQDESALAFSSTYYQALGLHASVKTAFELACNRIDREGLPNANVPRLLVREGIDPSTVVLA